MSDSILQAMKKSRRLLFVLSPDLVAEKSLGLLECRLGLYLQRSLGASVVAVVCRSVSKLGSAEVIQLRQAAACVVTWRRGRSEPRRSRFWLRLRLALPVRPLALGRRLIDSTSSHSDLAALALQRVQHIQNHNQNRRGTTSKSRMNRRTSAYQSRGRGTVSKEEGPQRSSTCSGCPGFTGQGKDRRVELTVETGVQVLLERTDPDPDITQIYNPAHNTVSPAPPSDSPSNNQEGGAKSLIQQQLMGGRISEEVMSAEEEGLVG